MVELKIRLYKDSSGVLLGEFLEGLNGITQNNANVNEVLVIVDGFELAPGEVLRISYEAQNGAEHIDYTLMNDNGNGTYSAEIDYAVTNGVPNSTWNLGLQIASNWVETESYIGYLHKQNLVDLLEFKVNNSVKDRNGNYPKLGDITTLYLTAQEKIEASDKNAEEIGNVKTQVAGIEKNVETLGAQVLKNTEAIKAFVGGGEFAVIPVVELPTENINTSALYLLKTGTDNAENIYTEYLYVNGKWEPIGTMSVAVDLTEYVKFTDRDTFVKEGITEPTETWTDEDKAKACETIGALQKTPATGERRAYTNAENGDPYMMPIDYVGISYSLVRRNKQQIKTVTPEVADDVPNKDYVDNLPDYLSSTITEAQQEKWRQMIGIDGTGGNGYTLTEADKAEIANLVLALLPSETWTFTRADGSTVEKQVIVLDIKTVAPEYNEGIELPNNVEWQNMFTVTTDIKGNAALDSLLEENKIYGRQIGILINGDVLGSHTIAAGSYTSTTGSPNGFQNKDTISNITIINIYNIGEYAFKGCTDLVAVSIDALTIDTIGSGIFYGCTSLKYISINVTSDLIESFTSKPSISADWLEGTPDDVVFITIDGVVYKKSELVFGGST